ncbi:MAG: hypothetical protein ACREPU_00215 [Rhodanobacteraceae bacterium]
MATVATNRVVAEFYRGMDFPSDWAKRPTNFVSVGFARKRVFSVVVLLDSRDQPLAACWQADDGNEQFVRIKFDGGVEDDLLDGLNGEMAAKSAQATGHSDLFATMLWEPKSLQPDQGIDVHPPRYGSFFDPIAEARGWNVAPGELVAKASDLLLVTRWNTTGRSLPVPANAEEMHRDAGDGGGSTFLVLPATRARARD